MLKLISTNIELHKHLEKRILPFLSKEQPEILCMQEVFHKDFAFIKSKMHMDGIFAPNAYSKERDDEWGVAILTKRHIISGTVDNYRYVDKDIIPEENLVNPAIHHRSLVSVNIKEDNRVLRIATTQFTWIPYGEADDRQREDIEKLLKILKERKIDIITGDFNAPRGREIFSALTEHYKDNIPKQYTTSIDKNLHRHGDVGLMVDGLFTTNAINVNNVKLLDGISDHMAVVAEIE